MSFREGSRPLLLSTCRALRGVAQGYLLATLLPDLHALGWSSLGWGSLLSSALLADFLLTAAIGILADHFPPGRILLAGDLLGFLSPIPYLVHPGPIPLAAALILSGAGQRSNGSPGPWAPPEQVLLARHPAPPGHPFGHFGRNMAAGLLGMSAGALLAWANPLSPAAGIRAGLAGLSGLSLAAVLLILWLPEAPSPLHPPPETASRRPISSLPLEAEEKRRMSILVLCNILGGLSLGLVDPVIATWFLLRFHSGTSRTAFFLSMAFLAAAAVALALGWRTRPRALPAIVIWLQSIALAAALLLPFAPSLIPAAVLYAIRMAGTRAPGGIRQALALTLLPHHRSGLASGLHLSSLQVAQIAGPLFAGFLWHAGRTDTPLVVASLLSALSLALFWHLYRSAQAASSRDPEELHSLAPAQAIRAPGESDRFYR